jgi:protein TonB
MEGGATWKCPFPSEADDVNDAAVPMRVDLDASGHVLHAAVLRDPGHGFGREAQRCVHDKRWAAALDRDGNPIAAIAVIALRAMSEASSPR